MLLSLRGRTTDLSLPLAAAGIEQVRYCTHDDHVENSKLKAILFEDHKAVHNLTCCGILRSMPCNKHVLPPDFSPLSNKATGAQTP